MTELTTTGPFLELLAAELERLKRTAPKVSFRAGQVIFKEGDVGDGVYVVEEGGVEISANSNGEEGRILSRLKPRNFFGEMAVLDDQPRSATATAEVDSILSFIPRDEMLRALKQSPELLIALAREFSNRMRQFDRRFIEEIFEAGRLALVGRFAQSIVHDFKNPLNIISFAAELAGGEESSVEERLEGKTQIRKQVDRLTNMINELLEFTRGAARVATLEPTNYDEFVQEFLKEIAVEAAERSVKVACENPPPAVSLSLDRARLLHVFYNLVNNAIDMMPAGGKITLRFSLTENEVVTELEDTGPGVAPEIAARLFEPFTTHGKTHGTGLGLSICKRIIEDHHGRIHARSEPGRGAVFSFTLPQPK